MYYMLRRDMNDFIQISLFRKLGHCPKISHYKAKSLFFGIVAIIKRRRNQEKAPSYITYIII